MRGDDQQLQTGMFSYVSLEDRIPADHPLRGVRKLVDAVLAEMSKDFDGLYSEVGRPSIAPERLLRALLLQVFYSVRSERLLMEQLNYNLLFRWFVGLEIDDAVWSHAVFSKNRDRLLNQDLAQKFSAHVKEQAAGLMSDEHFTVDGTLIEAWAGQKSFRRKDNGGSGSGGDFHGESRRNQTHACEWPIGRGPIGLANCAGEMGWIARRSTRYAGLVFKKTLETLSCELVRQVGGSQSVHFLN